jgi:phosphoserine phosphatase RsbX
MIDDAMAHASPIIEWGWAGVGLEAQSGDLHVVAAFPDGVLVGLLDGLGHGPEAAAASRAALPVLNDHAGDSLLRLVERCHDALRKTRGAAMSLASFRASDSSMTWVGVGNVEGVLLRRRSTAERPDEALGMRGGVVGYRLPSLRSATRLVSRGDIVILATDGIRDGFAAGLPVEDRPQEIAESIVARFAKATDDAHVVVARFLGGGP